MILWRVFYRPPSPKTSEAQKRRGMTPAVEVGFVRALDKASAQCQAEALYDCRPIEVVSDVAWRLTSPRGKQVFIGTFVADGESKVQDDVRLSWCQGCGAEIRAKKPENGKRWGRSMKWCDKCLSPKLLRWRKRGRERAEARRAAKKGNQNHA